MSGSRSSRRARGVLVAMVIASLTSVVGFVMPAAAAGLKPQIVVIPPGSAYRQRNLVSDVAGMALLQDPLLVNPWGISMSASSPFWMANNGTSTTQLFKGDVSSSPFILNASPQTVTIPGGLPTGTVFNSTSDFNVTPSGGSPAPARFIFDSITGNITAWQSALGTTAKIVVSNPGHVYTGLAIANNGAGNFIYAADFANGTIDVFDSAFALQPAASFPFVDPTIPTTAGNTYHPFNIQNIGGSLYVLYAKVGTDGRSEAGVGNGFVRRFNTNGVRDLTFAINNGPLNAPWGATIAPATFGIFGGALLIGNFGEGNPSIHAFNPTTGAFLGTLQNEAGDGIEIDELWALTFGNGGAGGSPGTLYFTAGIGEEEHGLIGALDPTTASATSTIQFSTDEFVIGEGSRSIQVSVTRSGNASGSASVRYATWDKSQPGHASQKSDYMTNAGVLNFAPGETSRTFTVRIVNDRFVEGDEVIDLALSNPTGAGVGLGSPNAAELKISDNDSVAPTSNVIDDSTFFVRQHFLDFFGREPSSSELRVRRNLINACATAACRRAARISVSAQIMLSPESLNTLGVIYRLHRAAFRNDPLYGEVMLSAQVRRSLGALAMLRLLMSDPRFAATYKPLSNAAYVNLLVSNARFRLPATTRNAWIAGLNNGSLSRNTVLLRLASHPAYKARVRNRWEVLVGYWAYFRRDPDTFTFNIRLNRVTAAHGNVVSSGLVKGFLTFESFNGGISEYRQRFGPN
jgi:uncharacterized protein (TIGR03118 family)